MRVRDVREDDLQSIADLEVLAFDDKVTCSFGMLRQLYMGQRRHWLVVCDAAGRLLANSMCLVEEGEAWVFSFCVQPELQNRGIGRHLMQATVERLRSSGIATARLTVKPDNVPALAVFRRFGFQEDEVGKRLNFLGPGLHRTVMVASLDGAG